MVLRFHHKQHITYTQTVPTFIIDFSVTAVSPITQTPLCNYSLPRTLTYATTSAGNGNSGGLGYDT